ncbi:MAG: hypothetical protein GY928_12640 [Colwellia sp.]|nr:hypothetical protein [Colwellia sp.]
MAHDLVPIIDECEWDFEIAKSRDLINIERISTVLWDILKENTIFSEFAIQKLLHDFVIPRNNELLLMDLQNSFYDMYWMSKVSQPDQHLQGVPLLLQILFINCKITDLILYDTNNILPKYKICIYGQEQHLFCIYSDQKNIRIGDYCSVTTRKYIDKFNTKVRCNCFENKQADFYYLPDNSGCTLQGIMNIKYKNKLEESIFNQHSRQ